MINLTENFGNIRLSKKQKTKKVQEVFDDVAQKYDLMNDIMSLGLHRLWKTRMIELINLQKNNKVLDIGSGTGDIGLKIANNDKKVKVYLCDLNLNMLNYGKNNRDKSNKINWINLNAEALPFENNYFDKYLISFCLRNVTNIEKALEESYRVLAYGGEFFCLEFSDLESPIFEKFYNLYKNKFIPLFGKLITKKEYAYRYLSQSIDKFPNKKKLEKKLYDIGYKKVNYYNLFNGIVTIHKCWKI